MIEAGRNAPCPCGSGKKFKHCHGPASQTSPSPEEAAWRRIRRAIDGYPTTLLRFIRDTYGRTAVDEAWTEFWLWTNEEEGFDAETPVMELFMPWFFHAWSPDPADTSVEDASLHERSPTSVLLDRRAARLDPVLRRYLRGCVEAPFTFHEVLSREPGRALRTRDLFTRREHEVLDRSASATLEPGYAFFGQVVSIDGITLLEACGPLAIPPGEKLALIDLRERISRGQQVTDAELKDWDIEIREAYLDLFDHLTNPAPPRLQNTDGDDLVFHRLVFAIESSRATLAALWDLSLDETEADLLEQAELEPDGEIRQLTLDWKVAGNAKHKGWNNTVHGHIEMQGGELRAEVNSAERAARLRSLIEERLGEHVRHLRTEIESLDDLRSRAPSERTDERASAPPPDTPEIRAKIRELIEAHYEQWPSEPLPALGGLTPRDAARDPVGREKLEALIADMEQRGSPMERDLQLDVFRGLREQLGLVQKP